MENDEGIDEPGTEKMDRLFSRTDFVAESPGLKERLWQKIQRKITQQERDGFPPMDGERELADEELFHLAAAGTYPPIKDRTKP